ncbi:unnamed protein product [Dicrocoelium dendriticum]|nr:unnamed protein product [Dicrocoelium dendriticum]
MLLPGSAGVVDPCEPGGVRLHSYIAVREQDEICCTAQTLLRALLHGSYEMLFNYDEYEDESNATFMRTVSSITWSQPVITSSDEQ